MMEGTGAFDRINATGKLALNSSAASLGQITGLIAPLAPSVASRLNSMGLGPGPARLKLALAVDKDADHADRASARAVLDLDAPQFKGSATITAKPEAAALRGIDLDKLRRSEISLESKLSSEQGSIPARAAGARRHDRGGRGPGAIPGIGDRRMGRAAAAERQAIGRGTGRRSAGHGRAVGAAAQGQRRLEGAQRQSRAAVRSQTDRQARAKHQPVVARCRCSAAS